MISAGNDIIALQATDSNRTRQPNFYSKILLPDEKALYHQPEFSNIPFENFVWLLWSIKESAYKFLKRLQPELLFTPVKFSVKHLSLPKGFTIPDFETAEIERGEFDGLSAVKGVVEYNGTLLYSNSLMYNQLIASIADNSEDFEHVSWGIKSIRQADDELQSAEVRKFLTDRLSNFFGNDITIEKNTSGVPLLKNSGNEVAIPISLSHHGNFVAYSFKTAAIAEPVA